MKSALAQEMEALLSETAFDAMSDRKRLDAAMRLVEQAWDQGYDIGCDTGAADVLSARSKRRSPNPYRVARVQ